MFLFVQLMLSIISLKVKKAKAQLFSFERGESYICARNILTPFRITSKMMRYPELHKLLVEPNHNNWSAVWPSVSEEV